MKTSEDDTGKEIASLLQRQMGIKEISTEDFDKDICELVGIYGDDTVEFMEDYESYFHVDMANYIHNKYFENEGFDIAEIVLNVFWRNYRNTPLTIRRLSKIALEGKWPLEPDGQSNIRRAKIIFWGNRVFVAAFVIFILTHYHLSWVKSLV